jgi:hypothetical protein
VALPFTVKSVLKAKEKLWKLKNFTTQKSKRYQNPSRYYNSLTNLKFTTSQNIIFQKSSYKNRTIIT